MAGRGGYQGQQGGGGQNYGGNQQYGQQPNMYRQQTFPAQQYGNQGGYGGGGGQYGYPQQQGGGYNSYEQENFDNDDYENLEEIERVCNKKTFCHVSFFFSIDVVFLDFSLHPTSIQFYHPNESTIQAINGAQGGNDQYGGEYLDDEDAAMAELEEEMQRARVRTSGVSTNRSDGPPPRGGGGGGAYLPPGAVPSQNGVLSAHAKEFWFPECRNCTCCKGFKHGCDCCTGGVDTCTKDHCVSSDHNTQVASQLAARGTSDVKPSSSPRTTAPAASSSPRSSGTSGGAYLPPGAVPSQNGVLNAHAKEFWFPECRNCTCCKGFKHGCDCCTGGVDTCTKGDCVSAEHAAQVASDLASKPTTDAASTGATTADSPPPAAKQQAMASAVPSSRFAAGGASSARPPMSDEICKFFLSGGCRFGDACRNQHPGSTTQGQGSSMATGGASPGGQRICQFFLSGNCQYGDNCRNAHVSRPPPAGP